jgi:hypothetical protein
LCSASFSRVSTLKTHLKSFFHSKELIWSLPTEEDTYDMQLETYSFDYLQIESSSICYLSQKDSTLEQNVFGETAFKDYDKDEFFLDVETKLGTTPSSI